MIDLKTPKEIEDMAEGGRMLSEIKKELAGKIVAGATGKEIDAQARALIEGRGARVSFELEPGYRWATCIDVNEGVVHGIPSDYKFQSGDVVGLDIGLLYKGFHTDTSVTVPVGSTDAFTRKFLQTGRETLNRAISIAKPGRRISDISAKIESSLTKHGFSPVKALSGHGVGRHLHEDPLIPCMVLEEAGDSPLIEPGMTLAIEVIYTAGSGEVAYGGQLQADGRRHRSYDGWTIVSLDGKIAAAFEDTIAITEAGPRVLT